MHVTFEQFEGPREGAVIVVDASRYHPTRVRWLARALAAEGTVHLAGEGLVLLVLGGVGLAEAWLVLERVRQQIEEDGWAYAVASMACWPLHGSSTTDVVAAALAGLVDERARADPPVDHGDWTAAGEFLTG
jgi:hypothetical protein